MTDRRSLITIGQLAKRADVSTSSLRYYEEQGLLRPVSRSDAGYRLYDQEAETTLRFIQRAQRLGFSLSDIRLFLDKLAQHSKLDDTVVQIAEQRYIEIERQLTERMVLRHELEAFLLDIRHRLDSSEPGPFDEVYRQLVEVVCDHGRHEQPARSTLEWLLGHSGCGLANLSEDQLLEDLRGVHVHIWQDGAAYQILIPTTNTRVGDALEAIARLEADCHAHGAPRLSQVEEGYQFRAEGENAFLFARIFLELEQSGNA